ncbi:GMC oxidoreductase-domain-containing protein, partial [Amylostereum chailletii]
QVGVIEAGPYVAPGSDPRIDLISQYGAAFRDPALDWGLKTVPQKGLNGRVIDETVAKVLGGSSMICDVLWQRASREEYDSWGTVLGNGPSWSFDALQPYFQKAENWTGPPPAVVPGAMDDLEGLKSSFGMDGPVQISYNSFYPDPIVPAVKAAHALGIRINPNPNDGNATGFSTPARAVDPRTGMRSSAVTAYFDSSSDRPNLLVLTGAQATKVLFSEGDDDGDGKKATGVQFLYESKEHTAKVTREVILSAGTFKTPQLLELSGIGNRVLLEHLGIKTVVDLPGVGENLQDQTYTLSDVVLKPGSLTLDHMRFNLTFLQRQQDQFDADRTGALTYDTAVTGSTPMKSFLSDADLSVLSSTMPSTTNPSLSPLQKIQFNLLHSFFREGKIGWAEFLMYAGGGAASIPEPDTPYNTPIVFHLYPFARGSVHVNTKDPLASPVIDPQYFSHDFDVTMHALSTAWLRTWMQTAPMAALVDRINAPSETDVKTPTEWEHYVRGNAIVSTLFPLCPRRPRAPLTRFDSVYWRLETDDIPSSRYVGTTSGPPSSLRLECLLASRLFFFSTAFIELV